MCRAEKQSLTGQEVIGLILEALGLDLLREAGKMEGQWILRKGEMVVVVGTGRSGGRGNQLACIEEERRKGGEREGGRDPESS